MKYYGGCDVGSTYTKAVILDENGKICADTTIRSKINSEVSAKLAMEEVLNKVGLNSSEELGYLIGTGYGRNKVPFADENISEISCHAMGVHVTDPSVKAIIDIGGQDVKGISIDTDGTVKNFAMNDKCAAGTGRFYEAMARSFEMTLPEFSNLSLTAKNVIPITAQCTVFAESEVITLVGEGKPMDEIAAGIQMAVAKRCFVMSKKAGATDAITLTGGCAKNAGLKQAIEHVLKLKVVNLKTDPQLMGAWPASEHLLPFKEATICVRFSNFSLSSSVFWRWPWAHCSSCTSGTWTRSCWAGPMCRSTRSLTARKWISSSDGAV